MGAQYQVVAECAHVTVFSPYGRMLQLMYKGAMVPAEAPEVERLLRDGFIAKVGNDETGGVDASGVPAGAYDVDVPPAVTSTPVPQSEERKAQAEQTRAEQDIAEKRAKAAAKLPEDGSAPKGTAGQDVFVEYLAGKGYDYGELIKQDKADLVEMVKQQS